MIRWLLLLAGMSSFALAQTNVNPRALAPVKDPLPAEEESAYVSQFSFIVYGDTRGRRAGPELQRDHARVVDAMLGAIKKISVSPFPVRFVLHTGDAVVDHRDAAQWNEAFVAQINRIRRDAGIPIFLTPGNHDIAAAQAMNRTPTPQAITNYLGAAAQLIPPDGAHRRIEQAPAYAFGYGNSFFVAIDSNLAANQTQFAWVTRQLEALDRKRYTNLFALFHHPPYSSGPHGGSIIENAALAVRNEYMPFFRKHRVNVVFAGHENFFEHWIERYNDADTNRWRMDLIVTGGGGAPPFGFRSQPNLTDYVKAAPGEEVSVEQVARPSSRAPENPFHFVIVRVDGHRIAFEVVGLSEDGVFKPYQTNKLAVD